MSTQQRLLRNYVFNAVQVATGLPTTSIFKSPRTNIPVELMPVISIFSTGDRPVTEDDDAQLSHERIYTLVVDVQVTGSDAEDKTDTLAVAIRKAVLTDDQMGQLAHRTTWASQEWGGLDQSPAISGTALTFNIFYLWSPDAE